MDFAVLETHLAYSFTSRARLQAALTHKSYLNETPDAQVGDNERLEFLGDAVLDLIISEVLMARFPEADEGRLSKMKSRVVGADTLTRTAREIGLGTYLLLGKGEEKTSGRHKPSLLADTLEAVIAAMYLDGGLAATRASVLRLFARPLQEMENPDCFADYKTTLQEHCQRARGTLPTYRVLRTSGPDHQKIFEVEVQIGAVTRGVGVGKNKKEAEQQAARAALDTLTFPPHSG